MKTPQVWGRIFSRRQAVEVNRKKSDHRDNDQNENKAYDRQPQFPGRKT
jgi:hypothetical protein